MKLTTNHKEEVELLKRESEIPLEDLLKDLPPDYLEDCNKSLSPQNATNEEEQNVCLRPGVKKNYLCISHFFKLTQFIFSILHKEERCCCKFLYLMY